jgi:ABC-type transporter Mla subunit MlaD
MYRWLAWVVVALLAASFASGCGGGDGGDSSATEWAGDVCSAITTWKDSITSTADSLKGGNLSEDALRSAADDVESATSDFVDDVRGLGKPDTDAGEQAKESLDQLADEADQNLSAIKSAVDNASGVSGAVAAVSAISAALSTMGNQLSSTFNELEQLDSGGELETAFKEADSCKQLESG